MPIYEYICSGCGHRFEKLVRSAAGEPEVSCPRCQEKRSERVLSTFSLGREGVSKALASAPTTGGG